MIEKECMYVVMEYITRFGKAHNFNVCICKTIERAKSYINNKKEQIEYAEEHKEEFKKEYELEYEIIDSDEDYLVYSCNYYFDDIEDKTIYTIMYESLSVLV